jgi:hypothetical protein
MDISSLLPATIFPMFEQPLLFGQLIFRSLTLVATSFPVAQAARWRKLWQYPKEPTMLCSEPVRSGDLPTE